MGNELNMHGPASDSRTSRGIHLAERALIALCIVLLAALACYMWTRPDPGRVGTSDRPQRFALNLTDQVNIDPQLIDYVQIASIALTLQQPRAIASGPQDQIYVAGDQSIRIFAADGQPQEVVDLDSQPQCLAAEGPDQRASGKLYVGMSDEIRILSADHEVVESWPLPSENMVLTSIAVAGDVVFVADAGNRVVWRLSATGEVLGVIGQPDGSRQIPGFVIPSSYFDIVAGSEGLLYCVNPGKLQISTFSFDGDLGGSWGRAGSSIADFFGCCNPSHIARFADGRFVTSERGIPRIKIYTATGELESVVAGPQQLGISQQSVGDPRHGINEPVFDVAVDSRGRVLVLDPQSRSVRIFARKSE